MTSAVIDRFEGSFAVLLVGEDEIPVNWPSQFLPVGVREGDYLDFSCTYNEIATHQAQEEAQKLLSDLVK